MKYFKVFYTRANNEPAYWVGKARSNEDAIQRADIHPKLVYDVMLLDKWFDICDKRKGNFLIEDDGN